MNPMRDVNLIPNYSDEKVTYNAAIYLTEDSMSLEILNKVMTMCKNEIYYHEFKIYGCSPNDRCTVFKTLLDFVAPITFTPIEFKSFQDSQCRFLAKDCLDFIMKIIANKFKIYNSKQSMKFEIIANAIPVDQIKIDEISNLHVSIRSRFHKPNTLNLSKFCEDESFPNYYPLYKTSTLLQVMSFAASYCPRKLILQYNHLKDANAIYPLNKLELISLDLSHNEISSLDDLECLKHFVNLKELYLSGNPICATYDTHNYVLDIKKICRVLEKLDGRLVGIFPRYCRNFFCNDDGHDLASQFLEHFFTLYDSKERKYLLPLYDKNAFLSVSSNYNSYESDPEKVDLTPYGYSKPFTVIGLNNIWKLLYELPPTDHDPYSFACDVPICTMNYATLSVKGIFKERNQILSFNRNFVFKRKDDDYSIINDQLFICNGPDYRMTKSFYFPKPDSFHPYYEYQYKEMENILRILTNMNSRFCRRLLDICGYDLKKTIRFFQQIYKTDDLPKDAFAPECFDPENDGGSNNFSDEIVKRLNASSVERITPTAAWKVFDQYRWSRDSKFSYVEDDSINRIYTKKYIKTDKTNKMKNVPLSQTLIGKPDKKTINIQLSVTKNSNSNETERQEDIYVSSKRASANSSSEGRRQEHNSFSDKSASASTSNKARRQEYNSSSSKSASANSSNECRRQEHNSSSSKSSTENNSNHAKTSRPSSNLDNFAGKQRRKWTTTDSKSKTDFAKHQSEKSTTVMDDNSKTTLQQKEIGTTLLNKSSGNESSIKSTIPHRNEIATNIARKLRLKELKKQLAKEELLQKICSQSSVAVAPVSSAPVTTNATDKQQIAAPLKSEDTLSKEETIKPTSKHKNKKGRLLMTPILSELKAHIQSQTLLPNHKIVPLPPVGTSQQNLVVSVEEQLQVQAQIHELQAQAQIQEFQTQTSIPMHPSLMSINPWETVHHNLMQNSLLGVPEGIAIPNNIITVPNLTGINAKLFTTPSVPVLQIGPNILRPDIINFNPDNFEPPNFLTSAPSAKTVKQQPSKKARVLDNEVPPPGVDLDEYLMEQGAFSLKRTSEDKIDESEPAKKRKISSDQSQTNAEAEITKDVTDEESVNHFKQILLDIYYIRYSENLEATRYHYFLDGYAKRLSFHHRQLVNNVVLDLDWIGINETKITKMSLESPPKRLLYIARMVYYIMTHEIFKKECSRKSREMYCTGSFAVISLDRTNVCQITAEKFTQLISAARDVLQKNSLPNQGKPNSNEPDIVHGTETPADIRTIKKYIYEILWKMLLKTNFLPSPVLLPNQRIYLINVTEIIANHIENKLSGVTATLPKYTRKVKQLGVVRNLSRALFYVINHDIFLEPACTDPMCLKSGKKDDLCSPYDLPFELNLARHAIVSVEENLFRSIRISRKIKQDKSLINAYNEEQIENLFPPKDPPDEPLHKDMFEEDITQYIFGSNSMHFYWKIVVCILRYTYNRKLKQQFYTETLPFLLEAIDKFVRTVGKAPEAETIVLKGTEKDFINIINEPDKVLKAIVVGIMHVITHEIIETSICENTSELETDEISIEDFNRSNICKDPIYHYPDIELLRSIRTHFIVAYRGDPISLPPFPVPFSKLVLPGMDFS